MAKRGASENYILTEAQVQLLWNQCQELEDKVLIGCLLFMGMRVGEAIHTKQDWLRQEEVHIPSQMSCRCWECRVKGYWRPKTKAGARVIPIPGFLQPVLAAYLTKRPQGLGITRQSAHSKVLKLAGQANLPKTFPHSLRATYATILASKGLTAMELCVLLGWSRISVGEAYVRLTQARAGAISKVKRIWG